MRWARCEGTFQVHRKNNNNFRCAVFSALEYAAILLCHLRAHRPVETDCVTHRFPDKEKVASAKRVQALLPVPSSQVAP